MRGVEIAAWRQIILSDTVGFISDLPHMLVSAFRATLEEVLEADVILHVRDIAHEDAEAQGADVEKMLAELGIDAHDDRLIEVWNKIDLLAARRARTAARTSAARRPEDERPCVVSAVSGEGLDHAAGGRSRRGWRTGAPCSKLRLDAADGEGQAWLYAHTEVLSRDDDEEGRAPFESASRPSRGRTGGVSPAQSRRSVISIKLPSLAGIPRASGDLGAPPA